MFTLNCKGRLLIIDNPIVMGIINVTPDSFYAASRKRNVEEALQLTAKMINNGAAIIDIGGQSTRPGSETMDDKKEAERIMPVIEAVLKEFPDSILSVDTYYSSVAKQAIETGASIINDISGGNLDNKMLQTAGQLNVPYICMHMKGTPATMQQQALYEGVTREVLDFFIKKTEACRQAGIDDVIVDVGFGFGKTIQHNFELLRNLSVFHILQKPLLLGVSRKSTIYKTLEISVENALNGTTVLHTLGLLNGAHILRVHDVKEAMEAIQLIEAYKLSNV